MKKLIFQRFRDHMDVIGEERESETAGICDVASLGDSLGKVTWETLQQPVLLLGTRGVLCQL